MKKLTVRSLCVLLLVLGTGVSVFGQQAKYIFYFIGDGMGMNTVVLAQRYQQQAGVEACWWQFPVFNLINTSSADREITDSAAAGTALATGSKTNNGVLGLAPDGSRLAPISETLKGRGYQVGILTSVSIDHATPASFYAHVPSRNRYHEIAMQLPASGFDFFGGSGFQQPRPKGKAEGAWVYDAFRQAGYTVCRGKKAYESAPAGGKIIYTAAEGADSLSLPYAIDRRNGELALVDLFSACLSRFSTGGKPRPFFVMCEGGKIDYAGHANDAACLVKEADDYDASIRLAFEFYRKYPKETLIVITADHETGGVGLGAGNGSKFNLGLLRQQKYSCSLLSKQLAELRIRQPQMTWEEMKAWLTSETGVKLSSKDEEPLKKEFDRLFGSNESKSVETLYSKDNALAVAITGLINRTANIGFTSAGHTAALVPLFAIGAGADRFLKIKDNTDIPKMIVGK